MIFLGTDKYIRIALTQKERDLLRYRSYEDILQSINLSSFFIDNIIDIYKTEKSIYALSISDKKIYLIKNGKVDRIREIISFGTTSIYEAKNVEINQEFKKYELN